MNLTLGRSRKDSSPEVESHCKELACSKLHTRAARDLAWLVVTDDEPVDMANPRKFRLGIQGINILLRDSDRKTDIVNQMQKAALEIFKRHTLSRKGVRIRKAKLQLDWPDEYLPIDAIVILEIWYKRR